MLGRPDLDRPDDIRFISHRADLAAESFAGLRMSLDQLSAACWLLLSPATRTSRHRLATTVDCAAHVRQEPCS